MNEPNFDWIGDEEPKDDVDEDQNCGVDSTFSATIYIGHEEDVVMSTNKTTSDKFLNILCPATQNDD